MPDFCFEKKTRTRVYQAVILDPPFVFVNDRNNTPPSMFQF